jgi:predicted RNA-binding Zn ribbon-like protein
MSSTVPPLVGEPLALDLINTLASGPEGEIDLLSSTEGFAAWLRAQAGRVTVAAEPSAYRLGPLRELRAHLDAAVDQARQGLEVPPAARTALVDAQRGAPGYRDLVWDGTALSAVRVRVGDPTDVLLADLAEAAVDLLTDPSASARVRRCEGPGCRLLFLPSSARRRWCSPALCGNRVRVARYYQRHKDDADR